MFYVSPYYRHRARETFANIALQLEPEQVREVRLEPRLREQDWGNYQRADCMRTAKQERGLFGRFFYRFPNGESGADVMSRGLRRPPLASSPESSAQTRCASSGCLGRKVLLT